MKIELFAIIAADSMGDGWQDQMQVAKAFATFVNDTWREQLETNYMGHEIEVEVKVDPVYSRDVSIEAPDFETAQDIEMLLNRQNDLWEKWCGSDAAKQF